MPGFTLRETGIATEPIQVNVTGGQVTITGVLPGQTSSFPPPTRELASISSSDLHAALVISGTDPLSTRLVAIILPHVGATSQPFVTAAMVVAAERSSNSADLLIDKAYVLSGSYEAPSGK
jgi:hypothetical protein